MTQDRLQPILATTLGDLEGLEGLGELKERALAAALEGITISDLSRPDNPIIYANQGFERLTGYSPSEVVGRNCRFLQGADTDPQAVDELRRAIAAGEAATVTLLNYRKDGRPFWNRLSITPVSDGDGAVSHYIGVQTDVSDRKRAEQQLQRLNRELEQANRRMTRGLEAAAVIQRSLLPDHLPKASGMEFAWVFEPCDELAGDSLDVFRIDDDTLGFYVLDVSGHGVPAALLSVTLARVLSFSRPSREGLLADARVASSPCAVAERLNELFPMSQQTSQYFTLFYGVLDLPTRTLRYVTAGHPAPVLLRHEGEDGRLTVGGFPVGMAKRPEYEERSVELAPGDRLYVYTDGLIEAANSAGEEFGPRRLLDELDRCRELPLGGSVEAVSAAAQLWAGGATDDDLSILALEIDRDRA